METKRADATRNREVLLAAAAGLAEQDGKTPSLSELAACAGLGVGTVYRHFPTRDALADALAEGKLAAMLVSAQGAMEGDGIEPFLRETIAVLATDPTLAEVFTRAESQHALLSVFGSLVERAVEEGVVRSDLTVGDIHHLVCGVQFALRLGGGDSATYTDVLLAGLKPGTRRRIEV
jgi:AcrR family transcriptional regulator